MSNSKSLQKIYKINNNITLPNNCENHIDIHRIFVHLNKHTKELLPKDNDIFAEYKYKNEQIMINSISERQFTINKMFILLKDEFSYIHYTP